VDKSPEDRIEELQGDLASERRKRAETYEYVAGLIRQALAAQMHPQSRASQQLRTALVRLEVESMTKGLRKTHG